MPSANDSSCGSGGEAIASLNKTETQENKRVKIAEKTRYFMEITLI